MQSIARYSRYFGGSGSAVAGPVCATCMVGMWGAMAARGAGSASAAAAMRFVGVLDWLPTPSWVPVDILRPVSAGVALLGLAGLGANWLRLHRRWAPFAIALPAVLYVLSFMYI